MPRMREAFLSARSIGPVSFATSSVNKVLQARHVFALCGLELTQLANHQRPYQEAYEQGPEALLAAAIGEIRRRVGGRGMFFIEDTAIRVEALSDEEIDVPGLAAKEWFADTDFESVDRELRRRGNDRRATILSRVALSVPGRFRSVMFEGESSGEIAETPPDFQSNPMYPWLNSSDFSSWFCPAGGRRLGEMSVDESYAFDPRSISLVRLIDYLETLSLGLNLPPTSVRRRLAVDDRQGVLPLTYDSSQYPDVILIGLTCAGKSLAAQWLSVNYGYTRLEGSAMMEAVADSHRIPRATTKAERGRDLFAAAGPDAVERLIFAESDPEGGPRVYTGARTIRGVETASQMMDNAVVVCLEANDTLRFERCLRRNRPGDPKTWEEFAERDSIDQAFGLLGERRTGLADYVVRSEGGLQALGRDLGRVIEGWSVCGLSDQF